VFVQHNQDDSVKIQNIQYHYFHILIPFLQKGPIVHQLLPAI